MYLSAIIIQSIKFKLFSAHWTVWLW